MCQAPPVPGTKRDSHLKMKAQKAVSKSEPVLEVLSGSLEETQALGERLGRLLQPGDVVALHGELGSGKTTIIQGIARGLGCESDRVKSPTFVLMREYPGRTPLAHLDGYRLEGAPAAAWLDLDLIYSPPSAATPHTDNHTAG